MLCFDTDWQVEALGKVLIGLQANVNYHNVAMGQGQATDKTRQGQRERERAKQSKERERERERVAILAQVLAALLRLWPRRGLSARPPDPLESRLWRGGGWTRLTGKGLSTTGSRLPDRVAARPVALKLQRD